MLCCDTSNGSIIKYMLLIKQKNLIHFRSLLVHIETSQLNCSLIDWFLYECKINLEKYDAKWSSLFSDFFTILILVTW